MNKYYIVLADDDEDDRYAFIHSLKDVSANIHLQEAQDGVGLINLLHQHPEQPHLIILDINMPRKSGIECLQEIRAVKEFRSIPIIVFSTSVDNKSLASAQKYGADFYIQKPDSFGQIRRFAKLCLNIIDSKSDGNALQYPFHIEEY